MIKYWELSLVEIHSLTNYKKAARVSLINHLILFYLLDKFKPLHKPSTKALFFYLSPDFCIFSGFFENIHKKTSRQSLIYIYFFYTLLLREV